MYIHVHGTCMCALYIHVYVQDQRRGVYVKGLTCRQANNEEDALNMLFEVCFYITRHFAVHIIDV